MYCIGCVRINNIRLCITMNIPSIETCLQNPQAKNISLHGDLLASISYVCL